MNESWNVRFHLQFTTLTCWKVPTTKPLSLEPPAGSRPGRLRVGPLQVELGAAGTSLAQSQAGRSARQESAERGSHFQSQAPPVPVCKWSANAPPRLGLGELPLVREGPSSEKRNSSCDWEGGNQRPQKARG